MTRIDRTEETDRLGAAQFTQHNPVGPKPKCCLQQVVGTDACLTRLAFDRDQTDTITVREPDLWRVLDQHDPLFLWYFAEQGIEERRLSGRRATRDQNRGASADGFSKKLNVVHARLAVNPRALGFQAGFAAIGRERYIDKAVTAYRKSKMTPRRRWAYDLDALAGW